MPRVAPFVAMHYDAAVVGPLGPLTAPPYDVISETHHDRFADANPYNVVHIDRGDRRDGTAAYDEAAASLAAWTSSGVLRRDAAPAYYAYEVAWPRTGDVEAGRFRGVFVALTLEPWGGKVIPHEETMPGPVEDRLRLLRATGTHLSPIYGIVTGPCAPLAALLQRTAATPPLEELVDEERVRHRVWRVPDTEPIGAWLADEALLIADGHHRYTTALAYREERHAVAGPGPWDAVLALVVDAGTQHVPVLPYHRVQTRGTPARADATVAGSAEMLRAVSDDDVRIGIIVGRGDGDPAFGTRSLVGPPPAVRALHRELLDELAPDDALRFTHSAAEAEDAVRAGTARAAYILPATTPQRIRDAVAQGGRLPRKSTFFWPKPRTGLLFMPVR
jgi:uncharacterized protein (DUF1015 family)